MLLIAYSRYVGYPEPEGTLTYITSFTNEEETIHASDSKGYTIDLSYYQDIGWEIELRYDLRYPQFSRQPFTGKQQELPKMKLSATHIDTSFKVEAPEETVLLEKSPDGVVLKVKSDFGTFTSLPSPFRVQPEPISLYEHILSTKVTDFSTRIGSLGQYTRYDSHTVRFLYPRPKGVVFGLPGQTGEWNRNGYKFELYNNDQSLHVPSRPPMYQSWPILLHRLSEGDGWMGIFHDNPSRTLVDVGELYDDRVTFESVVGNSRIYLFFGTNLESVCRKLISLLGHSPFPPLWAFGYQQSRYSYMNTNELRDVISSMESQGIPLDTLYLDIDSMDGARVFTNNPDTFSDLPAFTKEANHKGIQVVSILDPGVKEDDSYPVYNQLKERQGFLKHQDDSPFVGIVWPGRSIFPDFTDPTIREWWADLQCEWIKKNHFDGVWNDMNEPAFFDMRVEVLRHLKTSMGEFETIQNLYGYYMAMASNLAWKTGDSDHRGLIISRSGYPGIQRYAVAWHGDNYAWWEHLRLALNKAVAYAMCGAFYTGADVPGFDGNAPDDLAIRFFQLGAFLPFYRGHSIYFAKEKEPYMFTPPTRELIKQAITVRYSLLRFWYTGFEYATREHRPPLLPTFDDEGTYVPDQFLLCDSLLVAPVMERDMKRRLMYLPQGKWYPLGDTDHAIEGNSWQTLTVDISSIPIFVKEGTILPRNTVGRTTQQTVTLPETFEVYPDKEGQAKGIYYEDDGKSVSQESAKWYELHYVNNTVEKKEVTR